MRVSLRALYYLSHPVALWHRFRQLTFGYVTMGYVLRRMGYYLRRPVQLVRRLGMIHAGRRTIGYWIHAVFHHLARPRLVASKLLSGRRSAPNVPPPPPSGEAAAHPPVGPSSRDIANTWFNDAVALWARDPHQVRAACEQLEKALALSNEPRIVIHLAATYVKMNRNDEAMEAYRRGVQDHPHNRELWHHAGVHVLRHGDWSDARDLYDSILSIDRDDLFANFFLLMDRNFPHYVDRLTRAIAGRSTGASHGRRFIITCAVWGPRYVKDFLDYALASLLAEGNLRAMAGRHEVHFAIFTTAEDRDALRGHVNFKRASRHAKIHFIIFHPHMIKCTRSSNDLVSNPAKFALMSCSHYVALEAGRRLDADVMPIGADNIVNADFLGKMADILEKDVSVVALPGFRLFRDQVLPLLESKYRGKDGVITIKTPEFKQLLVDLIPKPFHVDSETFTQFPLFLCWRIEGEGLLVHANHLMPYAIRARFLKGPLEPSIDPVDGRFLLRNFPDISKIYIVKDTEMAVFDAADNPLVETRFNAKQKLSVEDIGLWLWCYWDELRERYFRTPIRIATGPENGGSGDVEREAADTIEAILNQTAGLEAQNAKHTSWRIGQ